MLSSLLRPRKSRRPRNSFDSSSPFAQRLPVQASREAAIRHAQADWTETENDDDDSDDESSPVRQVNNGRDHERRGNGEAGSCDDEQDGDEDDDEEDEDGGTLPSLLPIFSAVHLDSIPVYNLTHAIRLIIIPRVETQLTWDQLRSPQVSQFLIKPMQQQIRTSHFSRATLYALMANCLQFSKEGQMNPGNLGTCRTRAMVCELLALKLIKEYSTRELIDALSYDFYPLQGLISENDALTRQNPDYKNIPKAAAARISTLEVAIRAQAKKLLAQPMVVQQLEAIWAGTIVFHSTADHLHRQNSPANSRPATSARRTEQTPLLVKSSRKAAGKKDKPRIYSEPVQISARRTVTLYDPRDASLFKLSRLRVPRYRQFFSTCSLAILLGLFLAVLRQRSSHITKLEAIFWIWSAGFMLDEVVGFTEQGFSLYIMSFWNTFDLGILMIFVIYYCMRLYGLFLTGAGRHDWNSMAYDVLAANAVLLFPRLFSVLDHYRYFSQLLIAFRLMAVDLVAVFVLILISCSGFFVAFTLSFGEDYDARGVAYALFQMIMGFTPAAWTLWDNYNPLGQAILTLFLFICHFLIVTILITVLTNSFMTIVSNANEEHQFVFAVNTISMVKSDALFSYIAPSNLLAWILTPLRYVMPFRTFVRLNRLTIKVTHFPLLFSIFSYEKAFLARKVYEPTDLIDKKAQRKRLISFMDPENRGRLFSPNMRMRQDSVAGFQKDRALEEVFRLAPSEGLQNTMRGQQKQKTKTVVDTWMDQQEGIAGSPAEQDRSVVDRLERNREASKRETIRRARLSREASRSKSVMSDPADLMSVGFGAHQDFAYPRSEAENPHAGKHTHNEDDGDDELVTHDEEENMTLENDAQSLADRDDHAEEDYFRTPRATRFSIPRPSSSAASPGSQGSPQELTPGLSRSSPKGRSARLHDRNMSTATILFNPVTMKNAPRSLKSSSAGGKSLSPPIRSRPMLRKYATGVATPTKRYSSGGNKPAPQHLYSSSQPRPILPQRATMQALPQHQSHTFYRRRSSLDLHLDMTSDMGFDHPNANLPGAVPSSFATQMAMATAMEKRRGEGEALMGRIMLARMKTLEEGFAEVVKEFRESRSAIGSKVGSKVGSKAGSLDGNNGGGFLEENARRREKRDGKRVAGRGKKSPGIKKWSDGRKEEGNNADQAVETPADTPTDSLLRDYEAKGNSL